MYEDQVYKYNNYYDDFYVTKNLELKPISQVPKFLNPVSFIRILENYVPLESAGLENKGCFSMDQALKSTKRVTKLTHNTVQKEWIYSYEERDLIHTYSKVTSQLQYLVEWLNSSGSKLAHNFSILVEKYLENIKSVSDAHLELVEMEDYSESENDAESLISCKHDREYIKKIPDSVWDDIKTKCYFKRVSMYDKNKTSGALIETILSDKFVERTKMKPSLHDGHDGFQVYSLLTLRNWCEFYMQTFSCAGKYFHIVLPKTSMKVVDVNGDEVFMNDWDWYKELYIEGSKLYSVSIAVHQD